MLNLCEDGIHKTEWRVTRLVVCTHVNTPSLTWHRRSSHSTEDQLEPLVYSTNRNHSPLSSLDSMLQVLFLRFSSAVSSPIIKVWPQTLGDFTSMTTLHAMRSFRLGSRVLNSESFNNTDHCRQVPVFELMVFILTGKRNNFISPVLFIVTGV